MHKTIDLASGLITDFRNTGLPSHYSGVLMYYSVLAETDVSGRYTFYKLDPFRWCNTSSDEAIILHTS